MCCHANENLEVLKSISINYFRNIEQVHIDKFRKINFVIGENGQGKTNLIEAIFLSSKGKSFRFAENRDLIKFDKDQSVIKSVFVENDLEFDLSVQISESRLTQKINQKIVSKAVTTDQFPILHFSPESLSYIKESNDERRDLVDGSLIQTHSNLRNYWLELSEVRKSRATILKENLEGNYTQSTFKDLFASLNKQFYERGENWTLERIKFLRNILSKFEEVTKYMLGESSHCGFSYSFGDEEVFLKKEDDEIINILRKKQANIVEKEIKSGLNLWGPHKHQFKILFNGNDSRIFCSQGQQRTLILAYKMAQLVYHYQTTKKHPILLLDDVLSELDSAKQERLLRYLDKLTSQVFITTTHIDYPLIFQQKMDFSAESVGIFEMSNGNVRF